MRLLFIVGLLGFAFPAWGEEAVGRVRAVYYQAAPGVMVDASMLRRPGAIRWADVDIDGPDKRRALVQLPKEMQASVGDILTVDLAGPKSMALALGEPMSVSRAKAVNPQPQLARD
jgi:hypothetical protein